MRRLALVALALWTAAAPARAGDVTVFAAASLGTAFEGLSHAWENRTGGTLAVSLAGSSALARQIEMGAPADVFVSANPGWMDHLEARGLIDPDSRRDLLTNTLVVVAHGTDAPSVALSDLPETLGDGRLAMALTEAVPAGIYGRAALTSLGLWDALAGRTVETDNVRAALTLVALGEAPFGIVYATDARAEPRTSVAARVPPDSHPPIVYPAATVAGAGGEAAAFLDWLAGPEASAIFRAEGFGTPP